MFDLVSSKVQYTVADYVKKASRVVDGILSRGKLPIIVGGTGLYIRALVDGLPNLAVPLDLKKRKKLLKLTLKQLQQKLQEISIKRWEEMNQSDQQNPRRLIRAIEVSLSSDKPQSRLP